MNNGVPIEEENVVDFVILNLPDAPDSTKNLKHSLGTEIQFLVPIQMVFS